ncbi:NFU domain protein 4 [Perilla frutescens var. hirtella]|nr:NFU domain protein 4 [Perilla frutescens var. hirtella]KAH6811649.1 NFU domain protein 4 [Perilla frutescens var. frutescens]
MCAWVYNTGSPILAYSSLHIAAAINLNSDDFRRRHRRVPAVPKLSYVFSSSPCSFLRILAASVFPKLRFKANITEQRRQRQTRPPETENRLLFPRENSEFLLKVRAKFARLTMRNWGRLTNRAIFLSSSNGGLLSKPLNSQNPANGADAFRRFIFSSASSSSSSLSEFNLLKSSLRFTNHFQGQRRSMFIQTQSTPNPASLMFHPGKQVMESGSADFPNARSAMSSPLAKSLFGIDGITRVFFGSDFVTITKSDEISWDLVKPQVFAAIMDFYSSGQPLILDSATASSMDTAIQEDDSETVAMIKELLETRIRPAVQDDGGDIEYVGFDPDTGIVKLRMQGACSGCPSSSVTLKSGIENMLMHYVPEVKGVEQEFDAEDEGAALTGAPHE